MTLIPTIKLTHELCNVLTDMERNGLAVDIEELAKVKAEYKKEHRDIELRLQELAREVMGDTPINLNSSEDKSKLLYSRAVMDKKRWKETFNIGSEERGSTKRPKKKTEMTRSRFQKVVKNQTCVLKRTKTLRCGVCDGHGKVQKIRVDGRPFKNMTRCKPCGGLGVLYMPGNKVAGFKLIPRSAVDTSVHGFKCSSDTLGPMINS